MSAPRGRPLPLPQRQLAALLAAAAALLGVAIAPHGIASAGSRWRGRAPGGSLARARSRVASSPIAGMASASPTAPAPGTTTPAPGVPAPRRVLYRIVGCRSRGDVAYRHGPSVREVAIGFDDGPAPDTSAFLSMLERAHARATFFMIGRQISSSYRRVLLRELEDGDVLGDHTYSHPDLTASHEVRSQLRRTLEVIRALSGYTPCVFRPPYGAYDASVVSTARSLGLATVLWNVDPRDWAIPGPAAIERTLLAEVRPGSIIISHDGGGPRGQTLAAYPAIIRALRARGYRIVTIPELLGFDPVYEPCAQPCSGIGLPRALLPREAIVQAAP